MKWLNYGATSFLGVLGIVALFFDLTQIQWYFKLTIGILALIAFILSIVSQHIEKKDEESDKQVSEMIADQRTTLINKKLDVLNEKEKKGPLSDKDSLLKISLELERLNFNITSHGNLVKGQYLKTTGSGTES